MGEGAAGGGRGGAVREGGGRLRAGGCSGNERPRLVEAFAPSGDGEGEGLWGGEGGSPQGRDGTGAVVPVAFYLKPQLKLTWEGNKNEGN